MQINNRTTAAVSASNVSTHRLYLAGFALAAMTYGCVFLWQPVGQGLVEPDGSAVSRGGFIAVSLLCPENRIASWFDNHRLPRGFGDRIPIVFASLVWLTLGAIIGLPLVSPVFARIETWTSRIEQLSMSILVGLALLSTVTLVVGLVGGLKIAWILCSAIVGLVIGVHCVSHFAKRSESTDLEPELYESSKVPERKTVDRLFYFAIVAMTCFLAGVLMLGSCLPPSEFDVLEYHLQAPKEFFQQGAIGFVPHNIYANMPLGIEMHSLAIMTMIGQNDGWLGGLIGKSITAAFSLVGAALLGAFLARKFGGLVGWSAAGLWLATPGIAHVAMFGLIDGALATYVLASAVAAAGVLQTLGDRNSTEYNHNEDNPSRRRLLTYWRIAGVTSGAAAAAKYPGLILAVIPVCGLFVWAAWRFRSVFQKREAILTGGFIMLELFATCGPWYAKNWVLTGNPVYPLAADVFGGRTLTPEKIAQWKRAHSPDQSSANKANSDGTNGMIVKQIQNWLSGASRLLITSVFVQPAMIFGFLIVLFAAFLLRDDRRISFVVVWIVWSGWILLIWWFATHRIDRFWLPLTGLWAGLAAIGFWWLYQNVSPWLSQTIVILGIGYGCILNSSPIIADNRFFVSIEALRNDEGDENQVPRIFPTTAWVNRHLDHRNVRILLVGEARAFEFLAPVEYSTCFDLNPGEVYLRGISKNQQLATLRERGITHIFVQWNEINRYRQPNNYGFSDWPQPSDVQKLVDDGVVSRVDWGFENTLAELLEVK